MKFRTLLLLALATSLGMGAVARTPKKRKPTLAAALQPVSSRDFSYAMGVAQSNSLRQYLEQRHNVDSTQFGHFVEALNGKYSEAELARMRAIIAGVEIAEQNKNQMVPSLNEQATGKRDTSYVDNTFFTQGLIDGLYHKGTLDADSATKVIERQVKYREEVLKKQNTDYLAQYKKQKGVKATPSGLLYRVVKQGTGALPTDTSQVEVHYEGKLVDGTVFDSSYKRGETATFGVNQVIKGWTEALKLMPVGSEYELCIPYDLAYGERGTRGIPAFSTLIFKVELKAIK
ncbi:MAG: FKBP-type peptidyl-prolyl cis-trans isomerase [Bacteroidales bacterium]|nr:FKBP-type peptidyl-prolyl cis-trans isomerase [Bacteroidales bacterium]